MKTYYLTVYVEAPDDRIGLRAASEVADHILDHYRHDTLDISVSGPHRANPELPRSKYQVGPMEKR